MGYCVRNLEEECAKARKEIKEKNNGKLPEKYKHTTLDSCLYCPAFMSDF